MCVLCYFQVLRNLKGKGNFLAPHETISSMRLKDAASKVKGFKDKIISWFAALQPELYEVLPIDISVVRGAILFGNDATPRLLVATFSAGDGSYSMLPVHLFFFSLPPEVRY